MCQQVGQQAAGVLNIDKPMGITSHDVVARVRRLAGTRRVGHTGTLDPLATGVLLLCVGQATRIASYLQAQTKLYRTTVRLGESTTSYDAEGDIVRKGVVPELDMDSIKEVLKAFIGEIVQLPPMYSAVKYKGRPLYHYARAGEEVERKARMVTIADISVISWETPELTLDVTCSSGTYIRTLAHDLGEALACGGHVQSLRRLASGTWRGEDAVTLHALENAGKNWDAFLHGLPIALSMLPDMVLPAEDAYRFSLGQRIHIPGIQADKEVCVYAPNEQLIGIGRIDTERCVLSPYKTFIEPSILAPSPS